MATVKMIKKDAVISIAIGSGFFQKLQRILFYLTEERTDEELQLFKTYTEKNEDYPEQWMENLHTIIVLLKELENSADKNNQVTTETINDTTVTQPES